MAQTQKFRGTARLIIDGSYADSRDFYYHQTRIVSVHYGNMHKKQCTLNSGGYRTVTTKTAMNQASNEFNLGFQVYQKNYDWFVRLPTGEIVEFYDGLTFDLKDN